jgi:hypothetical protein
MSLTSMIAAASRNPHYVFGRFRSVRRAYSGVQRVRQLVRGRENLQISEKYGDDFRAIDINPSGLVSSAVDVKTHVSNLERDAVSSGLELTQKAHDHFLHLACTLPLEENGEPVPCLEEIRSNGGAGVALATVTQASHDAMMQALMGDAMLLAVVRLYLGYRPSHVSPWLFWSFVNDLSAEAREARYQTVRFHYDVHSYNFLYVNFYLTDSDERSGAHVLIQGSHRDKRLRHLLGSAKLSDQQAQDDYGESRIRTMRGNARSGFFEDTSCYHKAIPPIERDRLMLQIRYQ